MIDYDKLFEEINTLISEEFKKHEAEIKNAANLNSKPDALNDLSNLWDNITEEIDKVSDKWITIPNTFLGNISPAEYFANQSDFQNTLSAYISCSKILCTNTPSFLVQKLCSFENGLDSIISFATDKKLADGSNEDLNLCLSSIISLSMVKEEKATTSLIEFMQTLDNKYENVIDTIVQSLTLTGKPAIEPLLDILETRTSFNECHEHMLLVLSKTAMENKSDRIYKCLKSSFLRLENKSFGAFILADYGDGRAIPALRGFIEKNSGSLEKNIHFDIKYAIEKLGGTL